MYLDRALVVLSLILENAYQRQYFQVIIDQKYMVGTFKFLTIQDPATSDGSLFGPCCNKDLLLELQRLGDIGSRSIGIWHSKSIGKFSLTQFKAEFTVYGKV
jgi:hypothetical protein